ncbi:chorismate mutase [Thaumasiovibrio sp. DFM-14]|uniref:chorismate mutase n=1 Tax=Thaumasiovibrio sp. DFM-14 TaxID=3384792 RepID=UPI0039A20AF3
MKNNTPTLDSIRQEINDIDKVLVELLSKRTELALRISELKSNSVSAVQAKDRVELVIANVRKLAKEQGGNEDFIEKVYRLIIKELTDMQLKKKGLLA